MVSVITPTITGGLQHLSRLIPALTQNEKDIEIIIIDNDSRDGTVNYLSNFDCLIKVNKIRKNFSESNNQGAKYASGDYLLFLNNDTIGDAGFIEKMVKTFDLDPQIAIVGCLLYLMDPPKRVQHAGVYFTDNFVPYELGLEVPSMVPALPLQDPRVKETREVPSVTGACMMIRADVFWEVGGFDEGYKTGWEDTDLVLKAREKGYKVWYNGDAVVYHKHFGSKNAGRFAYEAENRQRYDDIWVNTGRAKAILENI
jgi:O-antigen biosynthesis protein